MRKDDLYKLPEHIPIPLDDGACDHLLGLQVPSIALKSTANRCVSLAEISKQRVVVYCYPRTGKPDEPPLNGWDAWDAIPGARGCTPI